MPATASNLACRLVQLAMSLRPTSLTPSPQASLPWPGADERCPKCQGRGDVYYLRAHQPAVEVLGGKRIICPVCAGAGTVRAPARKVD
jgi:hypothetical protein